MNSHETFLVVRQRAAELWFALFRVESPDLAPIGATIETLIAQDRRRKKQIELVQKWSPKSPEVRAAERAYQRALTDLVQATGGLLWKFARKLSKNGARNGMDLGDLYQEGVIGLMRATETFNVSRGVVFNTYAPFWIFQAMNKAVHNGDIIRLPVNGKDALKEQALVLHAEDFHTSTGDRTRGDGANGSNVETFVNRIVDLQPLMDEVLSDAQRDSILIGWLSHLDSKKVDILISRFWEEQTLDQIASKHSLSRERVRQIETIALEQLRALVKEEKNEELQ